MLKYLDKVKKKKSVNFLKPIWAINLWNFDLLSYVIRAAAENNLSMIIQFSEKVMAFHDPFIIRSFFDTLKSKYNAKTYLGLDHARNLNLIRKCIEAGWDLVMADYSHLPLNENISRLKQVVAWAQAKGVLVEGEVGALKEFQAAGSLTCFTDPCEAEKFVKKTKVNLLAVAIGTKHGYYRNKKVTLDFERLKAIAPLVEVPLVLHGGTGLSKSIIRRAVNLGIRKINISTEVKDVFVDLINRGSNYKHPVEFDQALLKKIVGVVKAKKQITKGL